MQNNRKLPHIRRNITANEKVFLYRHSLTKFEDSTGVLLQCTLEMQLSILLTSSMPAWVDFNSKFGLISQLKKSCSGISSLSAQKDLHSCIHEKFENLTVVLPINASRISRHTDTYYESPKFNSGSVRTSHSIFSSCHGNGQLRPRIPGIPQDETMRIAKSATVTNL